MSIPIAENPITLPLFTPTQEYIHTSHSATTCSLGGGGGSRDGLGTLLDQSIGRLITSEYMHTHRESILCVPSHQTCAYIRTKHGMKPPRPAPSHTPHTTQRPRRTHTHTPHSITVLSLAWARLQGFCPPSSCHLAAAPVVAQA